MSVPIRIYDSTTPAEPLTDPDLIEFDRSYNKIPHDWDLFQLQAFEAIRRNNNNGDVLVSAPTSSGKSHVGWYALKYHMFYKNRVSSNNGNRRHKIIYTAPIKTLSNEKFEEMTEYLEPYGIKPGLLTGDHRVNAESDFLIMTAEILSNALFGLNKETRPSQTNQIEQTEQTEQTESQTEQTENQTENQTELQNRYLIK